MDEAATPTRVTAPASDSTTIPLPRSDLDPLGSGDPRDIDGISIYGRVRGGSQATAKYYGRASSDAQGESGYFFVKVLRDKDWLPDFLEELRLAAKLVNVPNLATFTGQGEVEVDGTTQPYYCQRWLNGDTLAQRLTLGALNSSAVAKLAKDLGLAIVQLDRHGIAHGDIKPANVVIRQTMRNSDTPEYVLVDMGSATDLQGTSRRQYHTGTPLYLAPERKLHGGAPSTAADVWAWGRTVLYAATGQPPVDGDVLPGSFEDVPAAYRQLVQRALSDDPAKRPTPQELVDLNPGTMVLKGPDDAVAVARDVGQRAGNVIESTFGKLGRASLVLYRAVGLGLFAVTAVITHLVRVGGLR